MTKEEEKENIVINERKNAEIQHSPRKGETQKSYDRRLSEDFYRNPTAPILVHQKSLMKRGLSNESEWTRARIAFNAKIYAKQSVERLGRVRWFVKDGFRIPRFVRELAFYPLWLYQWLRIMLGSERRAIKRAESEHERIRRAAARLPRIED